MPSTLIKDSGHRAANGATASAVASTCHNRASFPFSKRPQNPHERPWVHKEDAVLLRYMAQFCDLEEWGMKVARWFQVHGKSYGTPGGPPRDLSDIVQRCERLQEEGDQYDLIVQRSQGWDGYRQPHFDAPLWDFDHETAARRYKPVWEDAEEGSSASKHQSNATGGEDRGEAAVRQGNTAQGSVQKQVKKQRAAQAEEESSEQGWSQQGQHCGSQQEDRSEGESDSGSSEAGEEEDENEDDWGLEEQQASHACQPQPQQQKKDKDAHKAAQQRDESGSCGHKRKREQMLLFESDGKRVRIGIPPKGTKVTYFPTNGSVQLIF